MIIRPFRKMALVASALLVSFAFIGCEQKGPAEKAGEKLDNAGKALDPRGPGEKAGDKVDNALGR